MYTSATFLNNISLWCNHAVCDCLYVLAIYNIYGRIMLIHLATFDGDHFLKLFGDLRFLKKHEDFTIMFWWIWNLSILCLIVNCFRYRPQVQLWYVWKDFLDSVGGTCCVRISKQPCIIICCLGSWYTTAAAVGWGQRLKFVPGRTVIHPMSGLIRASNSWAIVQWVSWVGTVEMMFSWHIAGDFHNRQTNIKLIKPLLW